MILTGVPPLFNCPPTLTLPHAGGGKRPMGDAVPVEPGLSLPPLWGRVGVGGLVQGFFHEDHTHCVTLGAAA